MPQELHKLGMSLMIWDALDGMARDDALTQWLRMTWDCSRWLGMTLTWDDLTCLIGLQFDLGWVWMTWDDLGWLGMTWNDCGMTSELLGWLGRTWDDFTWDDRCVSGWMFQDGLAWLGVTREDWWLGMAGDDLGWLGMTWDDLSVKKKQTTMRNQTVSVRNVAGRVW